MDSIHTSCHRWINQLVNSCSIFAHCERLQGELPLFKLPSGQVVFPHTAPFSLPVRFVSVSLVLVKFALSSIVSVRFALSSFALYRVAP